ncbi:hypothetical protein [Streptomyces sviceus]|uniref:hypothetical protein n=1 Tax=Streptomyces sviceus TaxID=285530 RepID=UPI00332095CD
MGDVFDPPPLSDFFRAMSTGTEVNPESVEMTVDGNIVGLSSQESVTIRVVPTLIRVITVENDEYPQYDYEFEGWLLGNYPERIHILGYFQVHEAGTIAGASVHVLRPGEETGTNKSFPKYDRQTKSYFKPAR